MSDHFLEVASPSQSQIEKLRIRLDLEINPEEYDDGIELLSMSVIKSETTRDGESIHNEQDIEILSNNDVMSSQMCKKLNNIVVANLLMSLDINENAIEDAIK